jgi:hypothetical protein
LELDRAILAGSAHRDRRVDVVEAPSGELLRRQPCQLITGITPIELAVAHAAASGAQWARPS